MKHTKNYQLNQWAKSDRVLMDDFNSDNQKIDAALGEKCGIVFGSYPGNDAASRKIDLGFTPVVVLVYGAQTGLQNDGSYQYGGVAFTGMPAPGVEIVEGGFRVKMEGQYIYVNGGNRTYYYIAFRV